MNSFPSCLLRFPFPLSLLVALLGTPILTAQTAGDWYGYGQEAETVLNFEQAINCYTKALAQRSDFTAALVARGRLYSIRDNDDLAIADFSQAIGLNARDLSALTARAGVHSRLKNYAAAIADYTAALAVKPDGAELLLSRASAFEAQQQQDRAAADYARVLSFDAGNVTALERRGVMNFEREHWADAIPDLTRLIDLGVPDVATVRLYRGVAYAGLGRAADALADLDAIIAGDNTMARPYFERGRLRLQMKNYAQAEADLGRAIELGAGRRFLLRSSAFDLSIAHAGRAEALRQLGREDEAAANLAGSGDIEGALTILNAKIEADAEDVAALTLRAQIYYQSGQFEAAHADCVKLIEKQPNDPSLRLFRATLLDQMGYPAVAAFERGSLFFQIAQARRLDPVEPGLTPEGEQMAKRANDELSRVIELEPGEAQPYYMRGLLALLQENYQPAIEDFSKLVGLVPDDPNPYVLRAMAYCGAGETANAMQDERKAISLGGTIENPCAGE